MNSPSFNRTRFSPLVNKPAVIIPSKVSSKEKDPSSTYRDERRRETGRGSVAERINQSDVVSMFHTPSCKVSREKGEMS